MFVERNFGVGSSGVCGGDPHSIVVARLDRAIQYAAAFKLDPAVSGILGRPVEPGDDSIGCINKHSSAISRRAHPTAAATDSGGCGIGKV